MEQVNRLGRGIEDVSRLYLSDTPRSDGDKGEKGEAALRRRRVVRIINPGSALMGAFFTANFSLELARHRHRVAIFDGEAHETDGVEAMLRNVVYPESGAEVLSVRLYGIPDISLYRARPDGAERLFELARAAQSYGEGFWLVVNTPHRMDDLEQGPAGFDAVLLSTLETSPLLQCYAYVKLIRQIDPDSRISLAFIDPASDARAMDAFSRFSAFALERLGACVDYLGRIVRDELMDRSIADHRPLVLCCEPSAARESIVAASRAFLQQRGALPPE